MKKNKTIVTVLGAGNMGTAISQVLADNGNIVHIWNWEGDIEPLQQIEKYHENKNYLKGVKLSENIISKYNITEALVDSSFVFLAIPTAVLEHTISFAARNIKNRSIVIDLSKGIDAKSLQITSFVIAKHLRPNLKRNIVTISGPAIASQMVNKNFTAMNIASKNNNAIKKVRAILENEYIKLVPTRDVIGVDVGGSFKNVYSIAIGMCEGLGFGLNTKAALLTYAIKEIADITKAMGGKRRTAYGLAGLGDLVGTSLCEDSRNHRFGKYLGQGVPASKAKEKVNQTIEGIDASECLVRLAKKYNLNTPFAYTIYHCIISKHDPRRAFEHLLREIL
ncbi:MAG: NAD(P)H-dependent glycerol-3-phosphate dehydrogenase [Candidatus Magasanikbacteria bacterium]